MSTLVQLKYGYDQAGNRRYRRDEAARAQSAGFDELYGYDGLNRLTSMDRGTLNSGNTAMVGSPTLAQDWTLDATGNWKAFDQAVQNALAQTREHNPVNEITGISETVGLDWAELAYDANGNTTTIPQPGALDESYTGVYDAWNRLVTLTDNANSGATVVNYQYDGLHRRVAKTTPSLLGPLVRHAYFSDRWQVLEERLGSSTTADQQFVWGVRHVDDLVLRDRFDITPGYDNRHYALQDTLFNVVAITDADGDIKERFAYQPYGQSEALDPDYSTYSGVDTAWQYRFTGRELDFESGMQINRTRPLHLQLGRWLGRDPIEQYSRPNLYQYVSSQPTHFTDASGLIEDCTQFQQSHRVDIPSITLLPGGLKIPGVMQCGGFIVKAGSKVTLTFQGERCKKCCSSGSNAGQVVEDVAIGAQVEGFLRFEVTSGCDIDFAIPAGGGAIKGYVGGRGEFGGQLTGSGGAASDKCNGVSNPAFVFCVDGDLRGMYRAGGSVRYQTKWFSWDIATIEAYVAGRGGFQICFRCGEGGCTSSGIKPTGIDISTGFRICALGTCYERLARF